jgi:hypothetical protein
MQTGSGEFKQFEGECVLSIPRVVVQITEDQTRNSTMTILASNDIEYAAVEVRHGFPMHGCLGGAQVDKQLPGKSPSVLSASAKIAFDTKEACHAAWGKLKAIKAFPSQVYKCASPLSPHLIVENVGASIFFFLR